MYRNNIKDLRMKLEITQEDLAKKTNLAFKSIYNIESGKSVPTIITANKIKNALNVKNIEDVFPEEEYK